MNQLITDQLIEEYQKKIEFEETLIAKSTSLSDVHWREDKINIYKTFILRLQSIRQQEVQNVMTAYRDGDVLRHLYKDSEDYFNQTFKQP